MKSVLFMQRLHSHSLRLSGVCLERSTKDLFLLTKALFSRASVTTVLRHQYARNPPAPLVGCLSAGLPPLLREGVRPDSRRDRMERQGTHLSHGVRVRVLDRPVVGMCVEVYSRKRRHILHRATIAPGNIGQWEVGEG